MMKLETQTIHTVKISWKYRAVFDKRDLVNRINGTVPDSAMIIDLAIDDATRTEPDTGSEVVMRTFKLTFATKPLLKNMRW